MAMTHKDYALIANAIVAAKLAWAHTPAAVSGVHAVETNIVQALARECPGFNAETFRAACRPKKG